MSIYNTQKGALFLLARAKYKKRSDGRYLVQIQTGFDENGKQKLKIFTLKQFLNLRKK